MQQPHRILVIFTGGTIGCRPPDSEGVLNGAAAPAKKTWQDYYLLSHFAQQNPALAGSIRFDVMEPLFVLSENMTLGGWNTLVRALQGVRFEDYDGIVITHGSDTLAYTACLLDVLLAGAGLPVVLVASGHELHHPRANGHLNFRHSVEYICAKGRPGVYVFYSYDLHKTAVYPGRTILPSEAFRDVYANFDGAEYGCFTEDGMQYAGGPAPAGPAREPLLGRVGTLEGGVLLVRPYVGLNYRSLCLDGARAVAHGVYHSFTACVDTPDADSSVLTLWQMCKARGVPLFIAPFSAALLGDEGAARYASTHALLRHRGDGVEFVPNASLEYTYTRLMVGCSLYKEAKNLLNFMQPDGIFA